METKQPQHQTLRQKRNPSLRARRAAKLIADNKADSFGDALVQAGYSVNTALNPQKVTMRDSFKAALAEAGLTEDLITSSLVSDIKAKPEKRVEELKLGAKILKMVDNTLPTSQPHTVNYNLIYQPQVQSKVQSFEDDLKRVIAHDIPTPTNSDTEGTLEAH